MSRAVAGAAQKQLGTSNSIGSGYNAKAGNLYSSLEPQLQQMATNPQGYSPTDQSAMRTGARQAVGGVSSGITGMENQKVARTRNTAGYNATLDEGSRAAGQQNSQDELGIDAANANLKQQQQQYALSSLGNLYGTNVGAGESYYGMAPSEINAWNSASPGWVQNMTGIISSLGDMGKGVGAAATGING